MNCGWKTENEGAFALEPILSRFNAVTRCKIAKAMESGYSSLIKVTTESRVQFGQACTTIKKHGGTECLYKIAAKYWLPHYGMSETNLKRQIQTSMQLYRFFNRKGTRLKKDVPIDTALYIFREIKGLTWRRQNKAIQETNSTGLFGGAKVSDTKAIRRVLAAAREEKRLQYPCDTASVQANRLKRFAGFLMKLRDDIKLNLKSMSAGLQIKKQDFDTAADYSEAALRAINEIIVTLDLYRVPLETLERCHANTPSASPRWGSLTEYVDRWPRDRPTESDDTSTCRTVDWRTLSRMFPDDDLYEGLALTHYTH